MKALERARKAVGNLLSPFGGAEREAQLKAANLDALLNIGAAITAPYMPGTTLEERKTALSIEVERQAQERLATKTKRGN